MWCNTTGLYATPYPSRVTDLIDLGVPWMDASQNYLDRHAIEDIGDVAPWNSVFYYPSHLSIDNDDFRSFAKGRERHITVDNRLEHVPGAGFLGRF